MTWQEALTMVAIGSLGAVLYVALAEMGIHIGPILP